MDESKRYFSWFDNQGKTTFTILQYKLLLIANSIVLVDIAATVKIIISIQIWNMRIANFMSFKDHSNEIFWASFSVMQLIGDIDR